MFEVHVATWTFHIENGTSLLICAAGIACRHAARDAGIVLCGGASAALRCDGIVAPCVLRQPINAISFLAWITQFLVPTLRPGDIVIMDNLSSYKLDFGHQAAWQSA